MSYTESGPGISNIRPETLRSAESDSAESALSEAEAPNRPITLDEFFDSGGQVPSCELIAVAATRPLILAETYA
jgi:hypothetical protein